MQADFLVYQAKAFYNAYIALEQVGNSCDDEVLFSVPQKVNGAFSVELTLKAILVKNNIKYGKEHNLYILFDLLPESFKDELLSNFFRKAPEYCDAEKFFDELILVSNAFVDWRYFFEGYPAPAFDSRFLSALANAAICTMFAHYNVSFVRSDACEKTDKEIEQMFRGNRKECKNRTIRLIQKKIEDSPS